MVSGMRHTSENSLIFFFHLFYLLFPSLDIHGKKTFLHDI